MAELSDNVKPSYRFWIWLLACTALVFGINTACAVGHSSLTVRIAMNTIGCVGIVLMTRLVAPQGYRRMLRNFWMYNIRGYDRVHYHATDGCLTERIEERWHRNALLNRLNGEEPAQFAVYERVTGWGWKKFRLGEFNGTPYIHWRNDIILSPRFIYGDILDVLIASDRSCPGIGLTIDRLLRLCSFVTGDTLSGGIMRLQNKMVSLDVDNVVLARLIGERDAEIGKLKQQMSNENVISLAAYTALEDLLDRIQQTTRFYQSKEGTAFGKCIARHRNGIFHMRELALKLQAEGTQRLMAMSDEDIENFRYPGC